MYAATYCTHGVCLRYQYNEKHLLLNKNLTLVREGVKSINFFADKFANLDGPLPLIFANMNLEQLGVFCIVYPRWFLRLFWAVTNT